MRQLAKSAALAAILVLSGEVASAQGVDIRVGPVAPRGYREAPVVRRGVVEERVIRRPMRSHTVCRTEVRERVTRSGVMIRRPVEVCRRVVRGF